MGMGPKTGEQVTTCWIRQETGFVPHKYDKTSELDVSGWVRQLDHRQDCRRLLNTADETAREKILNLFADPLIPQYRDTDSLYCVVDENGTSVWDRTVLDDYLGDINFSAPEMRTLAQQCSEYIESEENDFFGPRPHEGAVHRSIDDMRKEQIEQEDLRSPVKSISVNLTATEDQLVEDFRQWLRDKHAARRDELHKRKSKKEFRRDLTTQDFKKWGHNRVLAYIDLELFCRLSNKSLTDSTLGELLFPSDDNGPDVDPTERIRDTVAPLADKLTRGWYIDVLIMQASRLEQK